MPTAPNSAIRSGTTTTCEILYSYYSRSGGAYVDCLTTEMAATPILLPETLTLVSLEQTEDFVVDVVTNVPPRSIRGGINEAIVVRVADASKQPFVGRKMGVELYAGPSYDAGLATTLTCYRECIVSPNGYLHVVYQVASLSGESRRDVTDLLRVYLDKTGNGQYDVGVDPCRIRSVVVGVWRIGRCLIFSRIRSWGMWRFRRSRVRGRLATTFFGPTRSWWICKTMRLSSRTRTALRCRMMCRGSTRGRRSAIWRTGLWRCIRS